MRLVLLALAILVSAPTSAQEPNPALAPLAPLVGETWQGTFEADGQTVTDVSRWEWAMNRQALRNIHTLNGGAYGGETLIWAAGDSLQFLYVTSAGFTTSGTGHVTEDGALVVEEIVEGHPEIDRVRSTSRLTAEGTLATSTEMRRGGVWEPSRSAVYVRTPEARLAPGFAPACTDG
ncbi:MAG TPA: hypothetical protein EYQ24_14640 [Bacteroidetes bacterium]|nr:hypothetical protein [Bacteroidota bacterium]